MKNRHEIIRNALATMPNFAFRGTTRRKADYEIVRARRYSGESPNFYFAEIKDLQGEPAEVVKKVKTSVKIALGFALDFEQLYFDKKKGIFELHSESKPGILIFTNFKEPAGAQDRKGTGLRTAKKINIQDENSTFIEITHKDFIDASIAWARIEPKDRKPGYDPMDFLYDFLTKRIIQKATLILMGKRKNS